MISIFRQNVSLRTIALPAAQTANGWDCSKGLCREPKSSQLPTLMN